MIGNYSSGDALGCIKGEEVRTRNEMPNNGILDLNWKPEKIWNFLRSMDYGRYPIFPAPNVEIYGKLLNIGGYDLVDDFQDFRPDDGSFVINEPHINKYILLRFSDQE
jgi:hypothetical protein